IKASCKISTGGRIRDPLCSQTIQERFIIATQLDILQPLTIEQGIVSEVQDVITLVIGQMPLEQLQPAIDFLGQTQPLAHQVDGADAAVVDRPAPSSLSKLMLLTLIIGASASAHRRSGSKRRSIRRLRFRRILR